MSMPCYKGMHLGTYVPVGIIATLLFCFGPPLTNFVVLFRNRHALNERHVVQQYG